MAHLYKDLKKNNYMEKRQRFSIKNERLNSKSPELSNKKQGMGSFSIEKKFLDS